MEMCVGIVGEEKSENLAMEQMNEYVNPAWEFVNSFLEVHIPS